MQQVGRHDFYLYPRDLTLNLQDYRRARSTISSRRAAFNPETRRPWIKQDADGQARVQKNARPPISCQLRGGREPAFVPAKTERIGAAAITEHRFLPGSRETEEDW